MNLPDQLLKYHQHQGQTNDCAPFTTAMVINAVRDEKQLDGVELAKEMNWPRARWWGPIPIPVVRRIPNWATFPWGVADVLKAHAVPCRWRFGAATGDLHRALADGRVAMPIIGEWKPVWAHIKPLAAYQPPHGFAFADPANASPGLVWQNEADFLRLWKNYGNLLIETL